MWDLLECREALAAASSAPGLWSSLDHVRQVLGADSFSASRLYDDRSSLEHDHVHHLPPDAMADWSDEEARQVDPVMQHLKCSSEPIYWDHDTYAAAGQLPMWLALSRVGLSQGVGAVLHLEEGQHYVMGFDWAETRGRDPAFRARAMAATAALIPFVEAASRAVTSDHHPDRHGDTLTQREVECLRLVAGGKTACDIALILGISHHTANKHIDSCVRKLRASNRTHAATTAVRHGLL